MYCHILKNYALCRDTEGVCIVPITRLLFSWENVRVSGCKQLICLLELGNELRLIHVLPSFCKTSLI